MKPASSASLSEIILFAKENWADVGGKIDVYTPKKNGSARFTHKLVNKWTQTWLVNVTRGLVYFTSTLRIY